jgi:CDP-diacylglycerol--glycerol-3-phosphate 3-phosphatidyltransferase
MDIRSASLLPAPLKKAFLELLDPVADWFIRSGLRPNGITTISFLVLAASGVAFGLSSLTLGAVLLLVSGIFDLLDGKVARRGQMTTRFGAFYDSVMDRVGEAFVYTGLAVYFMTTHGQRWPVLGLLACFSTLSAAFLVSYTRARAEGLGIDCRVGIAQRAERVVGIGVPTMIWGAGPRGWLLLVIMLVLAVLSAITVAQRVFHVYRHTRGEGPPPEGAPKP